MLAFRGQACQTGRMRLLATFLCLGLFAAALCAQAAPRMSAQRMIDGLISHDAAAKDRAAMELRGIDAETAEKMGTELLRYGVREVQAVLAYLPDAGSAAACVIALVALESKELAVRVSALDVFSRVPHANAAEACRTGMNARRMEALRALIEDGQYLLRFCESISGPRPPIEEAMRLALIVDGQLGAPGLCAMLRRCAELMLGTKREAEDAGSNVSEEKALRLRRSATLLFEALWIADPATQMNYSPSAPFEQREKAVQRIRAEINRLENTEVQHGDTRFKGMRYGDYLQELFGSDVTDTRAAAYLRMQWWRGDDVTISGEGYAEWVDRMNAMARRDVAALRRDLRQWWSSYRTHKN